MIDIVKIIGIGMIALVVIIIMKQYKPEFALYTSIVGGILLCALVVLKLGDMTQFLETIFSKTGTNQEFIKIIFKITGIAILTEFAVSICRDSGESSIANKIDLGGKVIIISMSIPIISSTLESMIKILP